MSSVVARVFRTAMRFYPFPRGQGRLIDRTPLGALRFAEETLPVRTVDGFEMTVFPNDHIGRHLYLTGQFDRTIVEVLLQVAPCRTRGCWTSAATVGTWRAHCCMPCRVAGSCRSSHRSRFTPCWRRTCNRSAQDADARSRPPSPTFSGVGAMLHDAQNSGASRLSRDTKDADGPAVSSEPAEMITGPELMARSGLDRLDLVKIDVEGHEEPVLRSLQPVLARWRPRAVVFEHDGNPAEPGSGVGSVFRDLDYRVLGIRKRLTRYELLPVDLIRAAGAQVHDYAAVPRERTDAP